MSAPAFDDPEDGGECPDCHGAPVVQVDADHFAPATCESCGAGEAPEPSYDPIDMEVC